MLKFIMTVKITLSSNFVILILDMLNDSYAKIKETDKMMVNR